MTPSDPTASPVPPDDALALVEAARFELTASQRKLAQICELDRRVVAKWQHGRQRPYPWHWERMARAVHPKNVDLAARLAAAGGHTLVSLGLQAPPATTRAAQVAPPPLVAATHLVDSIVCAAAETMQVSPHAIRPALVAAFQRSIALGMGSDAVLAGLSPPAPPKASKKA
jgi:hypothetical protein